MRKIVLDSSIIVKWISRKNEERLEQSDMILRDVQDNKALVLAPELAKYEIGNALWKKRLELPQALDSFETISALPIKFIQQTPELLLETYHLCHNSRTVTFYDASFIALAKQEDAILVTDNPKHQKTSKEIKVIPLKDYQLDS